MFYSLVSAMMLAARRRTIYVFYDRGEDKGIERLALEEGRMVACFSIKPAPA